MKPKKTNKSLLIISLSSIFISLVTLNHILDDEPANADEKKPRAGTEFVDILEKPEHIPPSYERELIDPEELVPPMPVYKDKTYPDGSRSVSYKVDGFYHREDGPAHISYGKSGARMEYWYQYSTAHRVDGPAEQEYSKEGFLVTERWKLNGAEHREDGPSYTRYDPKTGLIRVQQWQLNGKPHREDGPAYIYYAEDGFTIERAEYFCHGQPYSASLGESCAP